MARQKAKRFPVTQSALFNYEMQIAHAFEEHLIFKINTQTQTHTKGYNIEVNIKTGIVKSYLSAFPLLVIKDIKSLFEMINSFKKKDDMNFVVKND